MNAKQITRDRYYQALRKFGALDPRTQGFKNRIEDVEEAALVRELMQDPEKARRVMRRIAYRLGERPAPTNPHPR